MNKITILGSGFGALTTIRELRRLKVEADITDISPRRATLPAEFDLDTHWSGERR
jgi:sulfide:quinone oxidoreductase